MKRYFALIVLLGAVIMSACSNDVPEPKPSTYLKLDVPKPVYKECNVSSLPFTFLYDSTARIEQLESGRSNMQWLNIAYDRYNYDANITVINIANRNYLDSAIEDCHTFLTRHQKLSSGIIRQDYENPEKRVYGTTFEIKGKDVVSPYQFYLTDSSRYFVRVALNSRQVPNNDSLAPVIEQLKKDMQEMIDSFRWK